MGSKVMVGSMLKREWNRFKGHNGLYLGCKALFSFTAFIVTDYKGHVRLQCSEGCSISYHPTCWRKFKGECVIGSDKDFLYTACPTPDCEGEIKGVFVHNDAGVSKIKVKAK